MIINLQQGKFLFIRKIGLITLFYLWSGLSILFAQAPSYFSITTDEGLPSNDVYVIHQDSIGFLWFATEDGLCKYNGSTFESLDHSALIDNDIVGIELDKEGHIWCWNMKGQLGYVADNKVKLFKFGTSLDRFKIIAFKIDSKGLFWLSTLKNGVWQFNRKTKKVKRIYTSKNSFSPILTIEEDNQGNIYLDYNVRIDTLGNKTNNPRQYPVRKTQSNRLFAHSWDSWKDVALLEIIGDSSKYLLPKTFPFTKGRITNVYEDKGGTIWLTTPQELFGIRKDGNWINDGQPFFSDLTINYFLQDTEGNYWLAIGGEGLRMYPSFDISTYTPNNSALKGEYVSLITSNQKKSILIGHKKGMVSILKNNHVSFKKFDTQQTMKAAIALKNNNFWLGAEQVIEVTDELERVKSFHSYGHPHAIALFEDTITSWRYGGFVFGITVDSLKNDPKVSPRVSIDRTYTIAKDYDGDRIWLGTINGLKYIFENKIVDFEIKELSKQPWVSTIIVGKDGNMWVGTFEQGVFWLKKDQLYRHYHKQSGLADNQCNTLMLNKRILWVGTNKGIHKIDLETNKIDVINRLDGLPDNEILALHKIDSTIYVGTPKGLAVFKENTVKQNKNIPTILITDVDILGYDATIQNVYDLTYDQNNIKIGFTGLNYRSQRKNRYKYRMLGVDTTWIAITNLNTVTFPALAPNHYTFQVKAINEDGVESTEIAELQFVINPPFWRTLWFNTALILGIIGFMSSVFYLWFQQYRQKQFLKNELDQKVASLTMRALQSQMNPHFVFNALNGIQRFILSGERKKAMAYLSKFARLIRLIFEYSKLNKINLTNELEFLALYLDLEKFRFKNKIEVNLSCSTLKQEASIFIPPLLVQPIIENAFKHGLLHKKTGGILNITFLQLDENRLKCTIEDNGVGRVASAALAGWKPKEYRSSGLQTTKDRLQLLNQNMANSNPVLFKIVDLKDENEKPIGTRVELIISIGE